MKNKNLFVVESPFQLLNAFEAISFFKGQNELIIRFSNEEINDNQIRDTLRFLNFNKQLRVSQITINANKKTFFDLLKVFILKSTISYKSFFSKKIFLGNYDSRTIRPFFVKKSKIILLDDGAKTINIQKGFQNKHSIDWFTTFNLNPLDQQNIFQNEYRYLKSIKSSKPKNGTKQILFIGSKLSEVNIISEAYYLKMIKKISNFYRNQEIVYVAHRAESINKINLIRSIENITVRYINLPLELWSVKNNFYPQKIVSFYSTSLITLSKILDVESIGIKFSIKDSSIENIVNQVFEFYKDYITILNEDNFK